MEEPRKKAKTSSDGAIDDGAIQIAGLQAELAKCRADHSRVVAEMEREKVAMEERHDRVVRDLKGSYSDALEWAYSVKDVDFLHWLGKGHTNEYASAMESFLDGFKPIIKELRTGSIVGDRVCCSFCAQDEDGNYFTAEHDDVHMIYWKELANALIHWSEYHANNKTLTVAIEGIETPNAVLDVLRPAIKQSKVKIIEFWDVGRPPRPWKLAAFMEDILQTNHELYYVRFKGVILYNEELKTICDAIRMRNAEQTSIIRYFTLTECFEDGIDSEVLKNILASNAGAVELEKNRMSSREASIIAECLVSNPPIRRLVLDYNRFDDADVAVLANSLSSSTNLRYLSVEGNDFTEAGRLGLLRAIFNTSSLNSCAASNQTCQGFDEDSIWALNLYNEATRNKWAKIFAILASSCEDSFINTALLNDVPVPLIPALLQQADERYEDVDVASGITDLYLELTGTSRRQKHDVWDDLGG